MRYELETSWHVPIASASSIGYDWDLQLAEDGMKMFFHRFETQAAFVGNLLIAAPVAH